MPVSTHSGVTEGAAGGGDGQGYTSRGAWTSGQDYAAYDIVTDGGQTFECYLGISNSTTAPASDTTHFRIWIGKWAFTARPPPKRSSPNTRILSLAPHLSRRGNPLP